MSQTFFTLKQVLAVSNEVSLSTDELPLPLYEINEIKQDDKDLLELVFYSEFVSGEYSEEKIIVDPEQQINMFAEHRVVKTVDGEHLVVIFNIKRPVSLDDMNKSL